MALKARENGIDLVVTLPDDLPGMVGDQRALKQIMLNLLSNSIKFTERGGSVIVSASVEGAISSARQRYRRRHRRRRPEADRRSVLPGRKDLSPPPRRHRPRPVDRQVLVALHGGEMNLQSRIGEGTTVAVALPLAFTPSLDPRAGRATSRR